MSEHISELQNQRREIFRQIKEIDDQQSLRKHLAAEYYRLGREAQLLRAKELIGSEVHFFDSCGTLKGTLIETWQHFGLVRLGSENNSEEAIDPLANICPANANPEEYLAEFRDAIPAPTLSGDEDIPF